MGDAPVGLPDEGGGLGLDPRLLGAARQALLTYGPAFMAPALWGFASFPERLGWTTGVSARIFALLSAFYDDWTRVDGYGEALEQALMDLRGNPHRILDLATGTGYAALRLKEKYPSADIVGVDVSPEMAGIAEHNAAVTGLDVAFQVADTADLPFDDGSFDLVVQQNAFPFPDEMLRVVRPGGKALVVYSFGGPWVSLAWPAVERRLTRAGAAHVNGKRAGLGFYGVARKRR